MDYSLQNFNNQDPQPLSCFSCKSAIDITLVCSKCETCFCQECYQRFQKQGCPKQCQNLSFQSESNMGELESQQSIAKSTIVPNQENVQIQQSSIQKSNSLQFETQDLLNKENYFSEQRNAQSKDQTKEMKELSAQNQQAKDKKLAKNDTSKCPYIDQENDSISITEQEYEWIQGLQQHQLEQLCKQLKEQVIHIKRHNLELQEVDNQRALQITDLKNQNQNFFKTCQVNNHRLQKLEQKFSNIQTLVQEIKYQQKYQKSVED